MLTYRWTWPCSMCACMLKTASRFSTDCIIFARFIFLSGGWSPDYTVSFCCRSCWSLQKKNRLKCRNCSAVILRCQERCTGMQVCSLWHTVAWKMFWNRAERNCKDKAAKLLFGKPVGTLLQLLWQEDRGLLDGGEPSIACSACCVDEPPACNVCCFSAAACCGLTSPGKCWLRKSFVCSVGPSYCFSLHFGTIDMYKSL